MDLYDLFTDRRLVRAGQTAAREALAPFTRRPTRSSSAMRRAAGS